MKMFLMCFKPKFYRKSKSTTSYMKIRLDLVRRKRIAMVKFLKIDIVECLKNGHDYDAYLKADLLLEDLRIISCYDIIERFCDCISENLSLMLKKRECPEECKEAVSSLIYAAAWVPDVPELKDLRALFTDRFGNFIDSYVNYELVEKTELRRRPSRELKIQTVKDVAKEFSINWDPTTLHLKLLRQTSALQIEQKIETRAHEPKIESEKSISDDESVLSESWKRDSLSKGSFSSSSSSSSSSNSSPRYTKRENRNGEKAHQEKKKGIDKENSMLLGSQGSENLTSNNEVSSTREKESTSSFQRPNILDYDEVVARLATLRRR